MATFTGTASGDTIDAGAGSVGTFMGGTVGQLTDATGDTINGLGGNDYISAGTGTDSVDAGAGSDTIAMWQGTISGNETIIGGYGDGGIDVLLTGGISDFSTSVVRSIETIDFRNPTAGGSNTAVITAAQFDTTNSDTATSQFRHNMTIIGETGQGDVLQILMGSATYIDLSSLTFSNFSLFPGDGDYVQVDAQTGTNKTIIGSSVRDSLYGAGGNDSINGGGAGDYLVGGFGDDTLSGDDGDDLIAGAEGVDHLFGGLGDDEIYFDPLDSLANVLGGDGNDTLLVTTSLGPLPTSFGLAAHQFENAIGLTYDTGANWWSSISDHYTINWEKAYTIYYADDGRTITTTYDITPGGAGNWWQYVTDYRNAFGTLTNQDGLKDDGGTFAKSYDYAAGTGTDGVADWLSEFTYFFRNVAEQAAGTPLNVEGFADDGRKFTQTNDIDANQLWTYQTDWTLDDGVTLHFKEIRWDNGTTDIIYY